MERVFATIITIGDELLIGQVIESYLMHAVSATVYPWVCARR